MWNRVVLLFVLLLFSGCSIPRWPVDGRMTSPFGLRADGFRFDVHRGVDISVPEGTPIHAMGPATVVYAGTMSGYGRVVILDHGNQTRSVYAHLSEVRVERGQRFDGRPVIGLSGSTGRASGPHLHFEILRRGTAEDPVLLLGGFPDPPRGARR